MTNVSLADAGDAKLVGLVQTLRALRVGMDALQAQLEAALAIAENGLRPPATPEAPSGLALVPGTEAVMAANEDEPSGEDISDRAQGIPLPTEAICGEIVTTAADSAREPPTSQADILSDYPTGEDTEVPTEGCGAVPVPLDAFVEAQGSEGILMEPEVICSELVTPGVVDAVQDPHTSQAEILSDDRPAETTEASPEQSETCPVAQHTAGISDLDHAKSSVSAPVGFFETWARSGIVADGAASPFDKDPVPTSTAIALKPPSRNALHYAASVAAGLLVLGLAMSSPDAVSGMIAFAATVAEAIK